MMYGLERLAELPLSLRLIREMHARLLRSGRAETKNPRRLPPDSKLGGRDPTWQRTVRTPTVVELDACLDQFERFIHVNASRLPPLIKAGVLHVVASAVSL
jgi:Fic family protein